MKQYSSHPFYAYMTDTTLDETETCSVYHVMHVEGENGVNLLGPFFAPSASKDEKAAATAQHAMDEQQCPVCLEMMALPTTPSTSAAASTTSTVASSSILTTVCNHSFHIDCLARWQDSPCPVCRYDHSGLNETLSRCHVCSTTQRNYVCLICGVVSCAAGPSFASLSRLDSNTDSTLNEQIPSQRGHALMHYEETLHAYALDTETQHVWDFAGGGYVHRLLQNEDGKIVETADPRLVDAIREQELLSEATGDTASPLTAMERSTIPTYSSSAEDDEAIHRKLEGFAGQYYTLLKSQLEQQRNYYEGRLEAIRREYSAPESKPQSTNDLISALKQERNQLEQRCATLRRKHKKVNDQAVFLKDMNESLEKDRVVFRQQIAAAQAELLEAKELTQRMLSPLEEKVHSLMLQLTGDDVVDDKKPAAK